MRQLLKLCLAGGLAGTMFAAAAPGTDAGVELAVHDAGEIRRLVARLADAHGVPFERTIRETTAPLAPTQSGLDALSRAAFATWTENGTERWSSYSRDGGASWSVPRRTEASLRLHDGTVEPDGRLPRVPEGWSLPVRARLFLVQLHTVALPEWRATLMGSGVELLQFFPHNAFVARMPPGIAGRVADLGFVARVEPFHPWFRVERELRTWAGSASTSPADDERRVRVMAFEWGPEAKLRILEEAQSRGATLAEHWPSGHVLELFVSREQLRAVAGLDDVAWIDRWSPPDTDMNLVRQDAGTDWLESNFTWCGEGVRAEVMDNGIDELHQDFDTSGVMMHTLADEQSHGTQSFGVVFGNGARDGDGDANATGHMPCAQRGIFADYNNVSDRFAHTAELKGAPYFASFQTNSWGSSRTTQYNSFSSEMDDIIWRNDIVITQSQSNAGTQNSRPQAWAKNIISVGGIDHQNTLDTSDDSWATGNASIGPAADGRIKPDLHYWYDSIYTTTTNDGYTNFCCTSAAAPQVAGTIGLLAQMWSENVWGTNPSGNSVFEALPHASTLRALAINTAEQYPFSGTGHDKTRTHQGWGRPNVKNAEERAAASFIVDEDHPLLFGERAVYAVDVAPGQGELKVTMIYPDPPGTTSSTLHRINDVNLEVVSPSGTVYHGNVGLDAGNYSQSGGAPNGIDPVENVFIQNPSAGTWTVAVEAVEINQDAHLGTPYDDVAFALVVTGATISGSCGNAVLDFGEECDGADLGGATCESTGCSPGGTLSCTPGCTLDRSSCTGCPFCGDGTCDPGEDCLVCAADCASASSVTCGNGICEAADGEDCVSCPGDCNGEQSGSPGSRYCCGDGDGDTPIPCSDSRCNEGGQICTDAPSFDHCCGDQVCESTETSASCAVDCEPPAPSEVSGPAASMLSVTGWDGGTETMTIDYAPACASTDSFIVYGELTLANLQAYAWSGEECFIGTTGTYAWDTSAAPASLFFVIVGQNAAEEGSYGADHDDQERPPYPGNVTCPTSQDLSDACGG